MLYLIGVQHNNRVLIMSAIVQTVDPKSTYLSVRTFDDIPDPTYILKDENANNEKKIGFLPDFHVYQP
jgi:hypothetical protein